MGLFKNFKNLNLKKNSNVIMLFDLVLVHTNDDLLLVQVPYCNDCYLKPLEE